MYWGQFWGSPFMETAIWLQSGSVSFSFATFFRERSNFNFWPASLETHQVNPDLCPTQIQTLAVLGVISLGGP